MQTETSVARDLDRGTITVDQAVELFRGDEVYVFKLAPVDPTTATWDEAAEAAEDSTLFHILTIKGATPEQMDEISTNIKRLSDAGHTTHSLLHNT